MNILKINRLYKILKEEGAWGIYSFISLVLNRMLVLAQRILLGSRDIYFQGSPRIIGRASIIFGANFNCGKNAWIEAVDPKKSKINIIFGDNFSASENFHIAAINSIKIGNDVLIGSNVLITDHSHGKYDSSACLMTELETPPNKRCIYSKGPIVIEDNVWIADGVKILPNVKIGFGSIIAANTVVRDDVPSYSIYGSINTSVVVKNLARERVGKWKNY